MTFFADVWFKLNMQWKAFSATDDRDKKKIWKCDFKSQPTLISWESRKMRSFVEFNLKHFCVCQIYALEIMATPHTTATENLLSEELVFLVSQISKKKPHLLA
jgi:hypothetical protein